MFNSQFQQCLIPRIFCWLSLIKLTNTALVGLLDHLSLLYNGIYLTPKVNASCDNTCSAMIDLMRIWCITLTRSTRGYREFLSAKIRACTFSSSLNCFFLVFRSSLVLLGSGGIAVGQDQDTKSAPKPLGLRMPWLPILGNIHDAAALPLNVEPPVPWTVSTHVLAAEIPSQLSKDFEYMRQCAKLASVSRLILPKPVYYILARFRPKPTIMNPPIDHHRISPSHYPLTYHLSSTPIPLECKVWAW